MAIVKKPPESVSRSLQLRTARKRAARRLRAVRRLHARLTSRIRTAQDAPRATLTTRSGRRAKTEHPLASAGHQPSSRGSHRESGASSRKKTSSRAAVAAITGIVLYFRYPFPEGNFFLELIFLWARPVFTGWKFSYTLFCIRPLTSSIRSLLSAI